MITLLGATKVRWAVLVTALLGCATAQAQPPSRVEFVWSGAVTSNAALVKAKVDPQASVRLVVSESPDFSQPIYVAPSNPGGNVLSFPISGLKPSTRYHYVLELDGKQETAKEGRFQTFPHGPASFTIAFGSCADTGSDHPVFETIRGRMPLFFLHMGDFHYKNITANDPNEFRKAYKTVLISPRQARLYREVPIAYVWDDHDFGGNNADSTSESRPAAQKTYREYVPHYPLPAGDGERPIYQSFSAGRVYFILTDERSERTSKDEVDNATKTVLGAAQKAWLKAELLKGSAYPLVVWMGTAPWIEKKTPKSDRWGGYSTERQELANFIRDHKIRNLVMLSGDAHMVAIDNGTNSDYAQGAGGGFPVMHAAALDQYGSYKGGPYSEGFFKNCENSCGPSKDCRECKKKGEWEGQFGAMAVTDTGGAEVCMEWSGWRQERDAAAAVELLRWKKCFPVPAAPP